MFPSTKVNNIGVISNPLNLLRNKELTVDHRRSIKKSLFAMHESLIIIFFGKSKRFMWASVTVALHPLISKYDITWCVVFATEENKAERCVWIAVGFVNFDRVNNE